MDYSGQVICDKVGECTQEGCSWREPRHSIKWVIPCSFGGELIPFTFQVGDIVMQELTGISGITISSISPHGGILGYKGTDGEKWCAHKNNFKFISRGGNMNRKEELKEMVNNFVDDIIASFEPDGTDKLRKEFEALKKEQIAHVNDGIDINRRMKNLSERLSRL